MIIKPNSTPKVSLGGEDYPNPYKQIISLLPNHYGTLTHSNTPSHPNQTGAQSRCPNGDELGSNTM